MNGLVVEANESSTPTGRGATWALTSRPSAVMAADLGEDVPPAVGRVVGLLHGERQAPAADLGQAADQRQLGLGEGVVGGEVGVGDQLDHALAATRCSASAIAEQLALAGGQGADVGAVAAAVDVGARGGEAERAGLQRLAGQPRHARQLVVGRAPTVWSAPRSPIT